MNDDSVQNVREPDARAAGAKVQPLPAPPLVGDDTQARAPIPAAPRRTSGKVRPASEAWSELARPLENRLGIRLLVFGITGSGKTTGVRDFLRYVEDRALVDLILIHDIKKPDPQYEGPIIHDARRIYTDPPTEFPALRVLRRKDLDHIPSVEVAARTTIEAGYVDIPTLLVVDEFQRALTDGGKFEAVSVRRIFCEGLGLHASIIATKQMPQLVPTEATGQSAKIYFRCTQEGINYLLDERKVSKVMAARMATLEVGEFVYVAEEGDWDSHVYQVPGP